jgi:hypothetical protein
MNESMKRDIVPCLYVESCSEFEEANTEAEFRKISGKCIYRDGTENCPNYINNRRRSN